MSAESKRREILQMLAKGSITAAEAGDLLAQITDLPKSPAPAPQAPVPPAATPPSSGKKARWLNVRVTDAATDRNKVAVRIPLSLARIGLRMGAKFAPEVDEVEWDEILSELASVETGTIVEVQDEEDGELVQVYVS